MENLNIQPKEKGFAALNSQSLKFTEAEVDSKIIKSIETKPGKHLGQATKQGKGIDPFSELSFTAQKVLNRLNELLSQYVPDGVQSLKPEDHTAEKTADRIVSQVGGLFGAYSKQNSNKSPEELLSGFMELARKGVQTGYDDAYSILKGIGAFDIEGVQSGVENTKQLLDQKLNDLEKHLAQQLGIEPKDVTEESISAPTTHELLAQGGVTALSLKA